VSCLWKENPGSGADMDLSNFSPVTLLTPTLYQTAQKSVTPDESFSDMTEGRNEQNEHS